MNKNAILLALLTIGGLIISFLLGGFIAQGAFLKLGLLVGIVVVTAICIGLRKNIWMLIPLCSALTGSILVLPVPFSVDQLAILLAFGMYLVLYAMKAVPVVASLNRYDGLMIMNLMYLVTVYIRNPAGILRFQTDIIGGRPYADVAVAILAYWVLQHVTINPRQRFLVPILTSVGAIGSALLYIVTEFLPGLAFLIHPFYSNVSLQKNDLVQDPTNSGIGRKTYLRDYGRSLVPLLVAFKDPTRLFLFVNPFLSVLFYSSFAAVLLSGFRSFFLHLVALSAVSTYFRSGLTGVVRMGVIGLLSLAVLITVQESGVDLPLPVQRALSFIPVSWDPNAVRDAQASSEWRFEMWRQALTSDRYIHNKIFGDGFGYRLTALLGFLNMGGVDNRSPEAIQEYFLVIGAYHSGPVSTVRTVGYVGLILFNIWLFFQAYYAWTLLKRSIRTPYFPWALFVASPILLYPFFYWLIFGGFENDLPNAIFGLAALNMLSRSLKRQEAERTSEASTSSYDRGLNPA